MTDARVWWAPVALRGWKALAMFTLSVIASYLLIGALRHGSWYILDDAEILSWMGWKQHVPLSDAFALLGSTEAAAPGADQRYRPLYYAFKVLECVLWGANPVAWFNARIALSALTIFGMWWALVAVTGPLWGTLLGWYTFTQYYWGDVWAHACLGEQYAAVCVAAMAVGGVLVGERLRDGARADGPLMLMAASAFVAVGVKENFAVLALPLAIALALCWRRRLAGPPAYAAALVAFGGAAFVIGAVLVGTMRSGGVDVYRNSTGLGSRARLLVGKWPRVLAAALALCAVAAAAVRIWVRRARPAARAATDRVLAQQAVVAAMVAIVFLSQLVFYNGQFPTFGSRYDFPGRATEIVVYASLIAGAGTMAQLLGLPRGLARFACGGALSLRALGGGFHVRDVTFVYVERTSAMRVAIATVLQRAGAGDVPVLLISTDPGDYESAMVVGGLLRTMRAPNPVFLAPPRYSPRQTADPFAAAVGSEMRRIAHDGFAQVYLLPRGDFTAALARAGGRCVALRLHAYDPFEPWPCDPHTLEGEQ